MRDRDFAAHVRRHLSRLDLTGDRYDEVVDELASELEARYIALVQRGETDEDAWTAVLAQVPSWPSLAHDLATASGAALRRERRESPLRRLVAIDRWLHDVKVAVRVLWKDRGFTITAIVTLAVCLGGHAAMVAGVNAVLLHPLRIPEPDRVLLMANQYPLVETRPQIISSTPDYGDRLEHVTVFEEQALYNYMGATIELSGVATQIQGMVATPSLLRLLRVVPAYGRIFTESEAITENNQRIILSDGLWRDLFGADPNVLGRTARLTGREYVIVGVMPSEFMFGGPDVRFWVPLTLTERQRSDDARHSNGWFSIGRLKPGATIDQVRAQLKVLDALNLERTLPQLKPILINTGFYTSVERLQDVVVRDVKGPLYVLWAAAVVVLVVGLGNLGNVALARSRTRLSELGTRLAIGAGRFDVIRQQLVEALLIAVVASVAGLFLGAWLLSALHLRDLAGRLPLEIDATVTGITLALGVLGGVLIGLVSAAPLFTMKLGTMLNDGSRGRTQGRAVRATRRTLVVAQMACSFMLLVGAGLLWVSIRHLMNVDTGFTTERVISGGVSLPLGRYTHDADAREFVNRSLESIRRIPGVIAAGATTVVPLRGYYQGGVILAEGYVPRAGEVVVTGVRAHVSPGYFEAVGTPLIHGRYFDERDNVETASTIVIDERLARRFWPDGDAIGRRTFRPENPKQMTIDEYTRWLTVIGVVRSSRLRGPIAEETTNGTYYLPYSVTAPRDFGYVIRTAVEPTSIVGDVRSALAGIDREVPLFDIRTMAERADLALNSRTNTMRLASLFALIAVFLSAIGLYGVLAYVVTQRRREIGVRLAVGSAPRAIVALILREGLGLAVSGVVLGAIASLALGRLLGSQLYGIEPSDPIVMLVMALTLSAVAALACVLPARRATQVDVMRTLSAR
jgi:predicted permease